MDKYNYVFITFYTLILIKFILFYYIVKYVILIGYNSLRLRPQDAFDFKGTSDIVSSFNFIFSINNKRILDV